MHCRCCPSFSISLLNHPPSLFFFFPSSPSSLSADYVCERAERSSRVLFLFTQAARVGVLELYGARSTRLLTQKGTPASPASTYLYRCASLLPLSKIHKDPIPPLHPLPLLFDIYSSVWILYLLQRQAHFLADDIYAPNLRNRTCYLSSMLLGCHACRQGMVKLSRFPSCSSNLDTPISGSVSPPNLPRMAVAQRFRC